MKQISISKPFINEAEKAAVLSVLDSGFLAQGPKTAEFESQFAKKMRVKHAIAVSSGTTALHIALLAHGVKPGDEVITTPFSFIATANSILFTGAKPVFVDIDPVTFNLDPALIEAAVTPRTKAIMPVHLYGQMCDMDRIQEIADKYNLVVIEDACQAVLATYKGQYAGSFGTGAFSFYATKNLITGEGGMVTTNDDDVAEMCRILRQHGMKRRYYHDYLGFNFRMTDIQAAIGLVQLEKIEELTRKRQENARFFNQHITSVVTPQVDECVEHVWHQYTVKVPDGMDRDRAIEQLGQAGIGTGVYYPVPIHQQKSILEDTAAVSLPVCEQMAEMVFSLPVHPQLTNSELEKIVMEVNKLC